MIWAQFRSVSDFTVCTLTTKVDGAWVCLWSDNWILWLVNTRTLERGKRVGLFTDASGRSLIEKGMRRAGRADVRLPYVPFVHMRDGQFAEQHLDKHLTELTGRQVVEEGVQHWANVEEGIRYRVEDDIAPEVRHGPVCFVLDCSHETADLVRHPASSKSSYNQYWFIEKRVGWGRKKGGG